MASEERLRELEEKYENYKVYDNQGSRIGKVDDLFIDEADNEEYIGVKLGFFGMRSTLIPMEIVRVNEHDRTIEVSESKDRVKEAPNFDDDDDITIEYEERIRSHFALENLDSSGRGSYAAGSEGAAAGSRAGETSDHTAGDDRESRAAEQTDREETTGESGGGSNRGYDHARGSGSEGVPAGESDIQSTPVNRQTEETETFEEEGRTKIRRRVIREEVEDAGQNPEQNQ